MQGSACEIMMIRTARRYDIETDTIVFGDGSPYTRESLRFGGLYDYVDCMFQFCKGMGVMSVDNAEYALLTAICMFSGKCMSPQGDTIRKLPEFGMLCGSITEFGWQRIT